MSGTGAAISLAIVLLITVAGGALAAQPTGATAFCKGTGEAEWDNLKFKSLGRCVSVLEKGGTIWSLSLAWRFPPNEENPSRDLHGDAAVWHYMAGKSLAHDPATYSHLSTYRIIDATTQQWDVNNAGDASAPHVRFQEHHNGIEVHPGSDRLVVVGWRSPVSGKVIIQGEFDREDTQPGGDGVDWRVEKGSATLASGRLVAGEVVRFREDLGLSARVAAGDVLYFIVGPGPSGSSAFDSTRMTVTIIQR